MILFRFRILAIDHDLISFVDVKLGELPIVLLTNPKSAEFLSSNEPLERMAQSSHIRLLAYSDTGITSLQVKIDQEQIFQGPTVKQSSGLFTVPWDPSKYLSGLHEIEITVQDAKRRTAIQTHVFSLDGTRADQFDPLATALLLSDIGWIMTALFVCVEAIMVWILVYILLLPSNITSKVAKPQTPVRESLLFKLTFGLVIGIFRWFVGSWRTRCLQLRARTSVFVFLMTSWLMMLVMPWFVAELSSSGNYGCIFFWGIVHFYSDTTSHYVVEFFDTMDTQLYALVLLKHFVATTLFFWLFSEDSSSSLKIIEVESYRRKRAFYVLCLYCGALYQLFYTYQTCKFVLFRYGWISLVFSPYIGWYNLFSVIFILQTFYQSVRKSLSTPVVIVESEPEPKNAVEPKEKLTKKSESKKA
jgi:hypothetical protein